MIKTFLSKIHVLETVNLCVVCSKYCEDSLLCCKCEQPIHVSCLEVCCTEVKMVEKVCRLCRNKRNINKERQGAKEYLEILSEKSYSEAFVGIIARIVVPEVNRGKEVATYVFAVALKKTDDIIFRLGMRNGQIKQLYSRSVCITSVCISKN